MAITYDPAKLLRRLASKRAIRRLVTQKLSVNRVALSSLSESGVLSKPTIMDITLKVIDQYKDKKAIEIDAGASNSAALETALNEKKLIVQRIQNASVQAISDRVKENYAGLFYVWLPSSANIPDPLHQLNYGKTFQLGVGDDNGEDPGDRYGCLCGMHILTEDDRLIL